MENELPDYKIIVYKDRVLFGPTIPLMDMDSINEFFGRLGVTYILSKKENGYMVCLRGSSTSKNGETNGMDKS